MLMDHLSSSRSLISSPYLLHHFIWPKGNNKSLIHYPLTEALMRKYLIRGNKLNFNHLFFPSRMHSTLNRTCKYAHTTHQTLFMWNFEAFISLKHHSWYSNYIWLLFSHMLWQIRLIGCWQWLLSSSTRGSYQPKNTRALSRPDSEGSWEPHLSWTMLLIVAPLLP